MIIQRIGIVSLAKIFGVLYGLIGIFIGVIYALFALAFSGLTASMGEELGIAGLGLAFGFGSIIFFPIFYGVVGFIFGLITAGCFNVAAKFVGGLQIDVTNREKSLDFQSVSSTI